MTWGERIARAKSRTRTVGAGPFWNRRREVHPNPGFQPDEVDLAWDWNTCPNGENLHVDKLPVVIKFTDGNQKLKQPKPCDEQLSSLGISFYEAVRRDEVDRAELCYKAIKSRARFLYGPKTTEEQVDSMLSSLTSREVHLSQGDEPFGRDRDGRDGERADPRGHRAEQWPAGGVLRGPGGRGSGVARD